MKFTIKKLCSKAHFLLDHDKSSLFTQGRWTTEEKVTLPYLLFKILLSFYLLVAYIISHVTIAISSESCAIKQNVTSSKDVPDHKHIVHDESNPSASTCTLSDWPYYWIYFTNWSWTLLCLSFLLDTTLTVLRYRKERMHLHHVVGDSKIASTDKDFHIGLKISWLLSNIAYPVELVVTIIYWAILYEKLAGALKFYNNINTHVIQTIVALVDTLISSRPWKIGHFYFLMLYSFIYILFQVLYLVCFQGTDEFGENYVYIILNWNSDFGLAAAIFIAILTMGVICHFMFCLLAYARDRLWDHLHERSSNMNELDDKDGEQASLENDNCHSKQISKSTTDSSLPIFSEIA